MPYDPRDIINAIERLVPHAPLLAAQLLRQCQNDPELNAIAEREGVLGGLGSAISAAWEAVEQAQDQPA
jgi:hypothetical protein